MRLPHSKYCDHMVLRAYTPVAIVDAFCKEGIETGVNRLEVKALEARLAVEDGADEIDMVFNIGADRKSVV